MKKYSSILISIIYFTFKPLFSSSDAAFASQSSIIPFQLIKDTKPMIHLGAINDSLGLQLISGMQIQPSSNLLLGGVISPRKINQDLSLYYQLLIGYIPKWKLFNFSSNIIQLGMHRYRFGKNTDSRWFSLSILESTRLGSLNINICWNKLFTKKWERNTILISSRIKLFNDIYLQPGAMAYFTPDFTYTPFLLFSMIL